MAKVETSVTELKLNKLTKEQYDSIVEPSNTELYFVTDEPISYNDLSDKPNLKPVAISGNYDDLNNKPVFNGIELNNTNSVFYGVSTTAAATAEKEVSIPSITQLKEGQVIIVQPTVESTVANSTLKLNDFDAYPMWYNNAAITTSTDSIVWSNKYPSIWVFNGTYWVFLAHGVDNNTTYTMNYNCENGQYTAGSGSYAISRYTLVMQKPDLTWEKIVATNANYTTGTKAVNTSGFLINQIRYYYTTTNYASGAKIANNYFYDKYSSIDARYSFNCGSTPNWGLGNYIYLVGTLHDDGLFYLDSTQWWTNTLPNTNDGKYYVRLGLALSATSYTISLFYNHPVFYHDGEKLCEYLPGADNKQDKLVSGTSIKTINNTSLLDSGDISTNDLLPDQTNNSGKFLTTDGTDISWASVDAFPSQSGNSGKFLMTDGSVVSWEELAAVATSGSYTDLLNKPTIEDLTTTAQQNALNSGATSTLIGKISTNESAITTINDKIPSAASSSNQLADKNFVNSTVTTLLARYITSSAGGDSFATYAALVAGPYYLDGTAVATSDLHNNDYAMVMEDETHDSKPARYIWSGSQWSFQYVLNNTTFTQAQVDAMNSTITQNLVNTYNTHVANNDIHVTTTDKNTWNAKQNAITGGASTITSNNLTASRALASNGSGKVAVSTTTSTELSYVHGVTSAIQTQLDSKAVDSNTVHKTGNESIAGYKTFTDPTTVNYLTVNPLNDSPTSKEGGEIKFVGASGEVNTGKAMFIDRCDGSLRLFGYNSNGDVHVQLQADAEHNTLYGVTPTEDTTSSRQLDTVGARNTKLQEYQTLLTAGTGIEIDGTNNINIIQLDKTYTEIGPINQSSEGVYFGFSNTAYVRLALGFTDQFMNGSGIFKVKTGNNLLGVQTILCDTATTQHVIGVVNGIPTFYNIEGITQLSSTSLSTNTWYWFAITADENGDIYYSCIEDNDYTIETLPPFSSWTVYTFILHNDFLDVFANTSLIAGKDFYGNYWTGEIDLKDSVAIVDNQVVWIYTDLGVVPAKATIDKYGLVRPDDTTITINDGIISYKNTNGYWTGNDVQNYRDKYITNCVTELPNDIKLELYTDGNYQKLKIKAGSKIYYPNGVNNFDSVVLENDETTINYVANDGELYVFRRNAPGTTGYFAARIDQISSGTSSDSSTNGVFYNTTTNRIDWYEGGNRGDRLYSFPICKITVSNGTITSIDQVFNGFGYIGSILFGLPNVKYLVPNGFNKEDGTLKSVLHTRNAVSIRDFTAFTSFSGCFFGSGNSMPERNNYYVVKNKAEMDAVNKSGLYYIIDENICYSWAGGSGSQTYSYCLLGYLIIENHKIISLNVKLPFHAVDYYEFNNLETKVDINDSNVVHKTGTETIAGTKTFTYYAKLASGTIFTKQDGQPSVEGGEFHFEKGDSDTTIHNYVVEDLYDGKVRFFGSCNKDGGGTEVRHPLAVDFTNNRINTPSIYLNNVPQNDTGTSSHFVPTVGWVNNSTSGVNNIVHKNGTETISGVKTFTDIVNIKDITYDLFDSTASSRYLYFRDKSSHSTGWVETRINHDGVEGESRLRLFAQTYTDNTFTTTKSANIDVVVKPDGTTYATAPTPAAGDNSTKIATTNWISDATKSTSIVHRNGNETIDGEKTFTGPITGRFRSASCHQGADNTNCWFKLGEFNSTGTYHNQAVIFRMWSGVNGNLGSVTGKIMTRTGGGGTAGTVEYAKIEFDNQVSWIDLSNFKLLYKASQGTSPNQYAIIELWVKTPNTYTGFCFSIQDERTSGEVYNTAWTFYNLGSAGTASELPSGYTQQNATYSDGAYVHIAGTETITGSKTFTNGVTLKITNMDETVLPNPTIVQDIYFNDKNNSTLGRFGLRQETDGRHVTEVGTQKTISNAVKKAFIQNVINANNEAYARYSIDGPTNLSLTKITSATNDDTIPTMGWVNNPDKSTNVVHRSGNETISGQKTFSDYVNLFLPTLTKQNSDKEGGQIIFQRANNDTYGNMNPYIDLYDGKIRFVGGTSGSETIPCQIDFANNLIRGTASSALFADLAENYISDEKYPIGTLIMFGGEKDITIAKNNCNGVISEKPGYLLDGELKDSQPIALVGKTPIRIIGKVNKHDKITLSEISGVGRVAKDGEKVIARALESSDIEEEKLVKCVTKFNLD